MPQRRILRPAGATQADTVRAWASAACNTASFADAAASARDQAQIYDLLEPIADERLSYVSRKRPAATGDARR